MDKKENSEGKAYRLIMKAIKDQYRPGDFLLEKNLAETLGMSRTPITIALNRLVSEGLLQKLPKKGCHIPNLNPDDAKKVFTARRALEVEGARLAAQARHGDDLQNMRTILGDTALAIANRDYISFTYLDEDFHHAMVSASGNMYIYAAWKRIYLRCNLYTRFFDVLYTRKTDLKQNTLAQHTAMCDAISAGNLDKTEEIVRDHIENALTYIM